SRHAIAVKLPRLHAWDAHVPVVVRPVDRGVEAQHARRPSVVVPVKQEQLHACGATGEQAKIHPIRHDGSTEGRATASLASRVHVCFFSMGASSCVEGCSWLTRGLSAITTSTGLASP